MNSRKTAKILIVDDDEKNRLLFKLILKKEGYKTVEAENGEEGIKKALEEKPDVILMDVMMPVMDGFTATNFLKNNNRTKHIPIIILTALDKEESKFKDTEKTADDILTKPIDTKELILKIKKYIHENH